MTTPPAAPFTPEDIAAAFLLASCEREPGENLDALSALLLDAYARGGQATLSALPSPAAADEAAYIEAKARCYDATLEALKSAHNRAMPFGQVMADLGLDQPPAKEPVFMRVQFGPQRKGGA